MEWWAYYQLEPFGEMPANWRAAMIATLVANIHRGKGQPPFKGEDFMSVLVPKEAESKPQQTPQDQKNVLQQIYQWAKRKKLTKEQ